MDLQRNAVVSVFLRMLEYYTGILFLTTNRLGAIDEAFKSRILISLYYPELGKRQFVDIWAMNLERTKQIDKERPKTQSMPSLIVDDSDIKGYAEAHWMENQGGVGKWNGRQIRNAFQTASALALYEAHKENVKRLKENPGAELTSPQLKKEHLMNVARATIEFDQYLKETIGRDDAEAAHMRGDRADRFRPNARRRQQTPMHTYAQMNTAPDLQHYPDSSLTPPRRAAFHQTTSRSMWSPSPHPTPYAGQAVVESHTPLWTGHHEAYSGYDYDDEYE